MSIKTPLVSPNDLEKYFSKDDLKKFLEISKDLINNRFKKNLANFSKNLITFYNSQPKKNSEDSISVSADSETVSLFQSFLSAWASNSSSHAPLDSGGFKAKLDGLITLEGDDKFQWIKQTDYLLTEIERSPVKVVGDIKLNFNENLELINGTLIKTNIFKLKERVNGFDIPCSNGDYRFISECGFYFFLTLHFRPKHEFTENPEITILNEEGKFALLGDWGSGLYGAPDASENIGKDNYNAIIHLGDIYYSGTKQEVEDKFKNYFPPEPKGGFRRALNGNHEMYSGGYGYFDIVLPEFKQESSYFALESENWLFVGLDTSYHAGINENRKHWGKLNEGQLIWLEKLVEKNKSFVLFTHHNPYSLIENKIDMSLLTQLKPFLEKRKVVAWYWGHEHACLLHSQDKKYGFFGRCIGHSGFAYTRIPNTYVGNSPRITNLKKAEWRQLDERGNIPGGKYLAESNIYIYDKKDYYGANGYLTLEFQGKKLIEKVHLPDATIIYNEELKYL